MRCSLFFSILLILLPFASANHLSAQSTNDKLMKTQMFLMQLNAAARPGQYQASLELTDEQKKELKSLAQNCLDAIVKQTMEDSKSAAKLKDQGTNGSDLAKFKRELKELQTRQWTELFDSLESNVNEVLLPHQITILKQRANLRFLQTKAKRDGAANDSPFSAIVFLAKESKLGEEEIADLEKRLKQIEKDYKKELAELNKKTNEKILKALPGDLKKKFREQIGDIDF